MKSDMVRPQSRLIAPTQMMSNLGKGCLLTQSCMLGALSGPDFLVVISGLDPAGYTIYECLHRQVACTHAW